MATMSKSDRDDALETKSTPAADDCKMSEGGRRCAGTLHHKSSSIRFAGIVGNGKVLGLYCHSIVPGTFE